MNTCKQEANFANAIDNCIENAERFEKSGTDSIKLGRCSTREADRIGSGFRSLRNRLDRRYALLCVLDVDLHWFVIA